MSAAPVQLAVAPPEKQVDEVRPAQLSPGIAKYLRRPYDEPTTEKFFALLKRLLDAGMCACCASGAAIERAEKAVGSGYKPIALSCRQRDRKRVCAEILAGMRAQPELDRREHAGPLPAHRQKPAVAAPPKEETKKAS